MADNEWLARLDDRQRKEVAWAERMLRYDRACNEMMRRQAIWELSHRLQVPPRAWSWMVGIPSEIIDCVTVAREYAAHFAHGTEGHNGLLLIAKLADLLDERQADHAANGVAGEQHE